MKILCFGDSNTYGYDPCVPFGGRYPAGQRWVDLLAQKLCCTCINAGENGRTIPRHERELQYCKQLLTMHAPVDCLIILLGSNDLLQGNSAESVSRRMEHFLKNIALEKKKICLVAPPPLQRGEWVSAQTLIDASSALIRGYEALAARLGIRFGNAEKWNIPLAFDGVHFTEAGHRAFAEGILSEKEFAACWKME